MDLKDVGWGSMDWIALIQDRDRWRALVKAVMNLRVPQKSGEFLDYLRSCWFFRMDCAPWSYMNLRLNSENIIT
jgi:hypothetical protein